MNVLVFGASGGTGRKLVKQALAQGHVVRWRRREQSAIEGPRPPVSASVLSPQARIAAMPSKLLFLPGAAGNTRFWQPVAGLLKHPAGRIHVGWPGFGPTPPDQRINGFDDLVAMVIAEVDGPTALIAQSMGGAVAMQVALARPDLITHLVLAVTSGGIDISDLAAQDWRPALFEADPSLPPWFSALKLDLTPKLGSVRMPTLLLWGDADPISPVAVGERLAQLLPNATLHVIENGTHDLADAFAAQVAPLIDAHLANAEHSRPSS